MLNFKAAMLFLSEQLEKQMLPFSRSQVNYLIKIIFLFGLEFTQSKCKGKHDLRPAIFENAAKNLVALLLLHYIVYKTLKFVQNYDLEEHH